MAAVACVGRAFVGREEFERDRDEAADLTEVARTGRAQEGLQFGERELDRIEVGAVGREESNEGAHLLDRRPHLRLLVDREVVEDDQVPSPPPDWRSTMAAVLCTSRKRSRQYDFGGRTRLTSGIVAG